MTSRIEQCQFRGQRMVDFMGGRIKELARCQERSDSFWHDEIGDAYCPRHAKRVQAKAAAK